METALTKVGIIGTILDLKVPSPTRQIQLRNRAQAMIHPLNDSATEDSANEPSAEPPEARASRHTLLFDIGGMTCANCVNSVRRLMVGVTDEADVRVNLADASARVIVESPRSSDELAAEFTDAVIKGGYSARLQDSSRQGITGADESLVVYHLRFQPFLFAIHGQNDLLNQRWLAV